jgi:serine/threonine-protein kinase
MVRSHFKDRYQSATEALHALQELINLPYPPTEYAMQQESTPQEPVAPDLQSPSDSELSTAPLSTAEPLEPLDSSVLHSPAVATASSKLALLLSVSVAAFVSSVGGLGLITNSATNSNPPSPAKVAKSPVGQLPAFTQLPESCSAFVTGNLRSEPTSLQDNIVDSVSEKLDVTGKQTSTGWIEVKRPNGNLVWAHRDVIPNQGEIDTCLQTQGIPVQIVDVSPQPVSPPQTNNGTQPADGSTSPPQTNNGTQPADGSTSPAQTNNSTQPADGSTSPAQTNNSTQPADGSTSPAQTNNGTQPTNGSTSPAQTNNANQPADGSTSPIQTNNANQPADGSTSPIQPNNANQPADSSNPSSNSSENLN